MKRRVFISIIFSLLLVIMVPDCTSAASFPDIRTNKEMYKIYNYRSGDCWLSANIYMLRRKAVLQQNPYYSSIVNDTAPKENAGGSGVRSVACSNSSGDGCYNDMKSSYTYSINGYSYTVKRASLSGTAAQKQTAIINALKSHPEGIAVWGPSAGPGYAHAVLITDYTNGQLYSVDSTHNVASNNTYKGIWNRGISIMNKGRTAFSASTITGIDALTAYMYIATTTEAANNHTISYNLRGGNGNFPAITVKHNNSFTIYNKKPVLTGYDFTGWALRRISDFRWYVAGVGWRDLAEIQNSSALNLRIYNPNETLQVGSSWTNGGASNSNYCFYAQWEPKTYNFSYDLNGVSGSISGFSVKYYNDFTISSKIPARSNYEFKGWNAVRTVDGKIYVAGAGWKTQTEINNGNLSARLYDPGLKLTMDISWIQNGGEYSGFKFKAVWDKKEASESAAMVTGSKRIILSDADNAEKQTHYGEKGAQNQSKTVQSSPAVKVNTIGDGQVVECNGNRYKVLSAKTYTVALSKAGEKRAAVVPASIKIRGKSYKVTRINTGAFKGTSTRTVIVGPNVSKIESRAFSNSRVTDVVIKTKKLRNKGSVSGSLKNSKVKTIKVKVGRTYLKKYEKFFTKDNAGKETVVKKG